MANLSILNGLKIKSIQRGSVTYNTGDTNTITVTNVDTNKSVLYTNCKPAYAGRNNAGVLGLTHEEHSTTVTAGAILTNGTTITWKAGTAMNNALTGSGVMRWELVEYY